MPQLMPSFFNNLIIFIMAGLVVTIYLSYYVIIPSILRMYLVRKYISKL